MALSKLERITIVVTLLILAFLSGWFLSRRQEAAMVYTPMETAAPTPTLSTPAATEPAPQKPLVNINTADADLLQTLPGIGEHRAADIIAYREANGPFPIPEAITDVPGIGIGTLKEIIDLICVEDEK